jgi:hypothetical protein
MERTSKTKPNSDEPAEILWQELPQRIPFAVDLEDYESPRGYLCRVAYDYRYPGPGSLVELAGLRGPAELEIERFATRMDFALRLPYKVLTAQRRIRRAGLPEELAIRLRNGQ